MFLKDTLILTSYFMVASNHISTSVKKIQTIFTKGRFRTDVFKFSLINRIVDLWSGLPVAIRKTDQLSLFSRKVNPFYISNLT